MYSLPIIPRQSSLLMAVLFAPLSFTPVAYADAPLRWKFPVGQKLACNVTQDLSLSMNPAPGDQKSSTTQQIMDMTLDVQGVNQDGEAVIVVKFDRIQSKVSYPVPVEFDT